MAKAEMTGMDHNFDAARQRRQGQLLKERLVDANLFSPLTAHASGDPFTTVSADGYVFNGTMYKIGGSTCVEIKSSGSSVAVSTCINFYALCLGKRDHYPVPAGFFGKGAASLGVSTAS